jgi:hypothetical protein
MLSPPFGRVVGSDCHCSLRGRDYCGSEYNPDGYRKQGNDGAALSRRLKVIPVQFGSLSSSRERLPEPWRRNGPENRSALHGCSAERPASGAAFLPGGGFYSGSFVSGRRHEIEVENGASPAEEKRSDVERRAAAPPSPEGRPRKEACTLTPAAPRSPPKRRTSPPGP